MYRHRARAAHKLQAGPQQQQQPVQQEPLGQQQQQLPPGSGAQQQESWANANQQQPQMQFFNPMQYQNGGGFQQPPMETTDFVNKVNGASGNQGDQTNGDWNNYNHNQIPSADQNQNNNNQQYINYNLNHQQGSADHQTAVDSQQQQQHSSQQQYQFNQQQNRVDYNHQQEQQPSVDYNQQQQQNRVDYSQQQHNSVDYSQQQQNNVASNPQQPELTLDPSGQWYWDYEQQQWFPYYQQQQGQEHYQEKVDNSSVQEVTQKFQQLGTESEGQSQQQPYFSQQQQVVDVNSDSHGVVDQSAELGVDAARVSEDRASAGVVRRQSVMSHISDTAMSHPMSTESGFRPDSQLSDATAAPTIPLDSSPPQQQLAASLSAPPPEDPFVAQVDNSMAIHASGPFSPPIAALSPPPPAAGGLTVPSSPAAAESPADHQLITFSPGTPMVSAGVIGAPVPVLAAPPDDQPPEPVVAAPDLHPPPPPGPPDLVDHRPNTSQPELVSDVSVSAETGAHHYGPPDLTSQSGAASLPPSLSHVSHDQHYEFYNQAYTNTQQGQGMPDVTGQQLPQLSTASSTAVAAGDSGKAPDILRTDQLAGAGSMVPSSDRNLYMETGELTEEDSARVTHVAHVSQPPSVSFSQGPASLPPMVGGNESVGPPMQRMVVGSLPSPIQPPLASNQRLVEGDNDVEILNVMPPPLPQLPQPPVSREVEGESFPAPSPVPAPPVIQQHLSREPIEGESEPVPSAGRPQVPGLSIQVASPPPVIPPPVDAPAETRSEAAGSDRRDVVMMGPPSGLSRAPPPPTPGRDIAGEESGAGSGGSVFRRDARDRDYDRDPYDSTDDRDNRDSDSGGDGRYGGNRRRNGSPGSRSGHHRPARIQDRSYRSSTDREDEKRYLRRDEDRRYNKRRDGRDRDMRSYYDYNRDERRRREEEEEDRRSERRYRRDDDDYEERRSHRGGYRRHVKREPRDDYEDRYSEYGGERPSRPSSRAGSITHSQYNPDSSFGFGFNNSISSQWAMFQQQQEILRKAMQEQMMGLNPLQFQIQNAVAEMEKALNTPSNVLIYKQHWDHYSKTPGAMEKLKLEQPVQHHLLQHFRHNFWNLVENMEKIKREAVEPQQVHQEVHMRPSSGVDGDVSDVPRGHDTFAQEFGAEDSSIHAELESYSNVTGSHLTGYGSQHASHVTKTPSPVLPERLTPLMFSRPHVCARLSAAGTLVKVEPNNPQDGQSATIELHSLAALLRNTKESQELVAFPGPLRPDVTHKNDVIKFCERKISNAHARTDIADKESYVLLWEMLVLLLRQKGQVEGSDLAQLLLKNKDNLNESRSRAGSHRDNDSSASSGQNDFEIVSNSEPTSLTHVSSSRTVINQVDTCHVDKFRSYLLHGDKAEGLEYAIKVGLWGHALFLASKMDQRTYAGVMTRFANGLAINDPLQTLYQLMSARVPTAMKQCGDTRWGDWRPHLAMILSNTVTTEINRRSIITLGDSLQAKGQLFAAQFCYIVSSADWGMRSNSCSKLVLLLSHAGDKSLEEFATTEAIQCTEIYEFVMKLGNKEHQMPFLQPYKYLHLLRLLETGHATRAQDYTRALAEYVTDSVSGGHMIEQTTVPGWVQNTLLLAEKLKYLDPVYTTSSGEITEISDPEWLGQLSAAVNSLQSQQFGTSASDQQYQYDQYGYSDNQGYSYSSYEQTSYDQNTEVAGSVPENPELLHGQQEDHQQEYQQEYQEHQSPVDYGQQYYQYQQQQSEENLQLDQAQEPVVQEVQDVQPIPDQGQATPSDPAGPPTFFNPSDVSATNSAPTFFNPASLPSIPEAGVRKNSLSRQGSVQTSSRRNSEARSRQTSEVADAPPVNSYYSSMKTPPTPSAQPPAASSAASSSLGEKPADKKPVEKEKKKEEAGGGGKKSSWFGGIFSKIIKKDQVHLPDDQDKRIIFDEAKGRWVNLDEDESESAAAAPPPMDPAFSQPAVPGAGGSTPGAATSNAPPAVNFRAGLTKKRGGRGYVDVLSQSGMAKPVSAPAMVPNGAPPSMPMAPPAMFTPAPVSSQDAPTSMIPPSGDNDIPASTNEAQSLPPMMFNPGSMSANMAPPNF